jgi:3-oxoacyl-[acyl-carrier-protein] synthase-3
LAIRFLRMDGQAVFKFAVRVLADVAHELMDAAGIPISGSTG